MAVYTIADLHLSHAVKKPMDKFGSRWSDHTEKIRRRWNALITEDDTVVIPGDISWAMTLEEAEADFRFLESLPGKKLLGKGNHDFWWTTVTKMKTFFDGIGVTSVDFLFNNSFFADGEVICGSRGWYIEEKLQATPAPTDYEKIVNRECARLALSLKEGKKQCASQSASVFLHFPPVFGDFVCRPLVDVMKEYGVKRCFFGHIHGKYSLSYPTDFEGIRMHLISADYLDFTPLRVSAVNDNEK